MGGPPLELCLLEAMGLVDGSSLRICRQGEPTIIEVKDTRVGLGARLAGTLSVELETNDPLHLG